MRSEYRLSLKFENIMLSYIFFYALFGRILNPRLLNWAMLIFTTWFILKKLWYLMTCSRRWIWLAWIVMLDALLVFLNILFTGQTKYLSENILTLLYPKIFAISFFVLMICDQDCITQFLKDKVFVLNIFYIINLIIVGIQLQGTGFMIRSEWLAENSYYADHCSGLFGNSGTHQLAFFAIFIALYNWNYSAGKMQGLKKVWFRIYTIMTQAIMIIYSPQNNNIAYLLVLPLMICVYTFIRIMLTRGSFLKKTQKFLGTALMFLIITVILFLNPYVQTIIYTNVYTKIEGVISAGRNTSSALGSNERLAIFTYALTYLDGWGLGVGLGSIKLNSPGSFGFAHFGLSSIGSLTAAGGIWFFLVHCLYYVVVSCLMVYKTQKVSWLFFMLSFALIICFAVYSDVFSSTTSIIWILLTFVVCGNTKANYHVEESLR